MLVFRSAGVLTYGEELRVKRIASCNGYSAAVRQAQGHVAISVEGFETARQFTICDTYAYVLAEAGGAGDPIGAHARKPLSGSPLRQPFHHLD
jgi:hypothetical protein